MIQPRKNQTMNRISLVESDDQSEEIRENKSDEEENPKREEPEEEKSVEKEEPEEKIT